MGKSLFGPVCAMCSCNYMVSPLCQIDFKARLTSWGLDQTRNWGKQLVLVLS